MRKRNETKTREIRSLLSSGYTSKAKKVNKKKKRPTKGILKNRSMNMNFERKENSINPNQKSKTPLIDYTKKFNLGSRIFNSESTSKSEHKYIKNKHFSSIDMNPPLNPSFQGKMAKNRRKQPYHCKERRERNNQRKKSIYREEEDSKPNTLLRPMKTRNLHVGKENSEYLNIEIFQSGEMISPIVFHEGKNLINDDKKKISKFKADRSIHDLGDYDQDNMPLKEDVDFLRFQFKKKKKNKGKYSFAEKQIKRLDEGFLQRFIKQKRVRWKKHPKYFPSSKSTDTLKLKSSSNKKITGLKRNELNSRSVEKQNNFSISTQEDKFNFDYSIRDDKFSPSRIQKAEKMNLFNKRGGKKAEQENYLLNKAETYSKENKDIYSPQTGGTAKNSPYYRLKDQKNSVSLLNKSYFSKTTHKNIETPNPSPMTIKLTDFTVYEDEMVIPEGDENCHQRRSYDLPMRQDNLKRPPVEYINFSKEKNNYNYLNKSLDHTQQQNLANKPNNSLRSNKLTLSHTWIHEGYLSSAKKRNYDSPVKNTKNTKNQLLLLSSKKTSNAKKEKKVNNSNLKKKTLQLKSSKKNNIFNTNDEDLISDKITITRPKLIERLDFTNIESFIHKENSEKENFIPDKKKRKFKQKKPLKQKFDNILNGMNHELQESKYCRVDLLENTSLHLSDFKDYENEQNPSKLKNIIRDLEIENREKDTEIIKLSMQVQDLTSLVNKLLRGKKLKERMKHSVLRKKFTKSNFELY